MQYLFFYLLAFCILSSNTDLVKAIVYFTSNAASYEQAMAFMQSNGIVDRFYILLGNAFNYAGVIFCWIIFRSKIGMAKYVGLFSALLASASYFFYANWNLWMPIAQGAQISDNFAIGFLKITASTNVIGILAGLLGLTLTKNVLNKAGS